MTQYKATTINGEPKLEPVNPFQKYDFFSFSPVVSEQWQEFKEANPPIPYIGSAIPDDTILDESEVEIVEESYDPYDYIWEKINHPDTLEGLQKLGASTRRVATRKEKPYYTNAMDYNNDMLPMPSNSEEGEQPMKEEIGIDELIDSIHVDKANFDYISSSPTQKINGTLRSEIKRIIKLALTKK